MKQMTEENILIPKNREEAKTNVSEQAEDTVYTNLQAEVRKLHMRLHQKDLQLKQVGVT